jgi:hypothetical protein
MKVEPQKAVLPAASDTSVPALPAVMTRAMPAATAAALAGTLGLAAACWGIAVWQMNRMDIGDRDPARLGLMAILVALGVMNITWMVVSAVLVLGHKLLPAKSAIDLPLALAIAGLGVLIVITPSLVPGLSPPM